MQIFYDCFPFALFPCLNNPEYLIRKYSDAFALLNRKDRNTSRIFQYEVREDYLKENGIEPDSLYEKNLISGGTWKGDIKYHIDNFIGDKGKEWMENRLSDTENKQPWFFTLSFPGPHHPYDLEGTKYADMYELNDMEFSESTYEDLEPVSYTHLTLPTIA